MKEICGGQPCPEAAHIYEIYRQLLTQADEDRKVVENTSVLPESAPVKLDDPETVRFGDAFLELGELVRALPVAQRAVRLCQGCPGREVGCKLGIEGS